MQYYGKMRAAMPPRSPVQILIIRTNERFRVIHMAKTENKNVCKTIEDLVQFMYDNTVSCADEYTDWNARRAARERAKELLDIDLGD